MENPSECDVTDYPKLNIELVLCFLTQIAHEAEGPTQDMHKGGTHEHNK